MNWAGKRTFSEGWNMRIELAKLLLSRPGVLLLDSTNHLDIDLRWLEQYRNLSGACWSYPDRTSDNVTPRTIEISLENI